MNTDQAGKKPLRLWLAAVAIVLWLLRFVLPAVSPDAIIVGLIGSLIGALLVILWWALFGRVSWTDRWGAVVLMVVAMFATSRLLDKTVATGMMSMMFPMYAVPVLGIAFAFWAIFSLRLSEGPRRASMVATILLACGAFALLRTNGISGDAASDFAWRWSKTHEEILVAHAGSLPTPPSPVAPVAPVAAEVIKTVEDPSPVPPPTSVVPKTIANWPGFRGPARDGVVPGIRIETDWTTSPPVELWRRPIGPGWSSFAVRGDLVYTQEQRGEDEMITCYNATTGNPVWAHRDVARFWESNAGAGPRGTPTIHDGSVYAFGATGILNALDARDGAMIWSRNAGADAGVKVPGWGFASSPLVVGDMVIVAASGKLAAFDIATGAPRWLGPAGGDSYSSPQLATIDGVEQILLMSGTGAMSVAPADGALLWKYAWPSDTRIMQPTVTADGDFLITCGDAMGGVGMRRIAVTHGPSGWSTEERWTSNGLKPSFSDSVIHDGYVFGIDGAILACLNLKDGQRKWKGGRYGHGQLVLLSEQGLLLVLTEEGGLALVKASPDQFTELAKLPAIEGKTWNHPVVAGDRLLVRNGEEMVAFRLPLARH